jgi:DNA-binding NarL/FixJ family response regulator
MFSERNAQDAMLNAGAAAYLAKTSPPEALIAAIRKCAGRSSGNPACEA